MQRWRRQTGRTLAVLLCVGGALALTAHRSGGTTPGCRLSGSYVSSGATGSAGGDAAEYWALFYVRNIGTRACRLFVYPRITIEGRNGRPVGDRQLDDRQDLTPYRPRHNQTLAPGRTASFELQFPLPDVIHANCARTPEPSTALVAIGPDARVVISDLDGSQRGLEPVSPCYRGFVASALAP